MSVIKFELEGVYMSTRAVYEKGFSISIPNRIISNIKHPFNRLTHNKSFRSLKSFQLMVKMRWKIELSKDPFLGYLLQMALLNLNTCYQEDINVWTLSVWYPKWHKFNRFCHLPVRVWQIGLLQWSVFRPCMRRMSHRFATKYKLASLSELN